MPMAGLKYVFIPYYFLPVLAIFTHVAGFLHWSISSQATATLAQRLDMAVILMGVVASAIIVMVLSSVF